MHKIIQFLQTDIWRLTTSELRNHGFLKRWGTNFLKVILLVVRGFSSKQLNLAAGGLTYNLVFAVIPILAMILAIAKGFGFADVIESQLNASFIAETGIVPVQYPFRQ